MSPLPLIFTSPFVSSVNPFGGEKKNPSRYPKITKGELIRSA
jgi:hypothetical protein